MKSNYGEKII